MLSTKDEKYMQMALEWAQKSDYRYRLGAIIVTGGRIRGCGYSKYRNSPRNVADQHLKRASVHAEADALREVVNATFFSGDIVKRGTIYVARLSKLDKPAMAKPCNHCTKILIKNGINTFVWTIDKDNYGITKVESLLS